MPLLVPRGGLMIANAEKRERFESHFAAEQTRTEKLTRLSVDEAVAMVPILDPAYVAGAYHDPEFWDIEVESLLQGYVKVPAAPASRSARRRVSSPLATMAAAGCSTPKARQYPRK